MAIEYLELSEGGDEENTARTLCDGEKITSRPNKEIACDSLQNPSDPMPATMATRGRAIRFKLPKPTALLKMNPRFP